MLFTGKFAVIWNGKETSLSQYLNAKLAHFGQSFNTLTSKKKHPQEPTGGVHNTAKVKAGRKQLSEQRESG